MSGSTDRICSVIFAAAGFPPNEMLSYAVFYGFGHAEGGFVGPTDASGALTFTHSAIQNPDDRSATVKAGPGTFNSFDPNDPRFVASVAFEVSC